MGRRRHWIRWALAVLLVLAAPRLVLEGALLLGVVGALLGLIWLSATMRSPEGMASVLGALWRWRLRLTIGLVAVVGLLWLAGQVGRPAGAGLLAGGALALWFNNKTRSRIQRAWWSWRIRHAVGAAFSCADLPGIGRFPGQLSYLGEVSSGSQLLLRLRPGAVPDALVRGAPVLAAAMGIRSLGVAPDPSHAGRFCLTLVRRDPLSEPAGPWPWLGRQHTDLFAPVPIGVDEHGAEVAISLFEHNLLVGGEPGAGKSVLLSLLVAAGALDRSCELYLFDPKLVELGLWKKAADCFVGPSLAEATVALSVLHAEMAHRFEMLDALKDRKIDAARHGLGLVLVVIDELHSYLTSSDKKAVAAFSDSLRDLVARGRAAGIVVVAATQKPAADVVPSALRDLFSCRLALRCVTKEASDTILGSGWATNGYSASEIDPSARGVGLLLAERALPRRLRCHFLDDDQVKAVAARAAVRRGVP